MAIIMNQQEGRAQRLLIGISETWKSFSRDKQQLLTNKQKQLSCDLIMILRDFQNK